jgi:hypothetical protein
MSKVTIPIDSFSFRQHQKDIWDKFFINNEYKRFFLCGARRSGKDYLAVRIAIYLCMIYENYHCVYVVDLKIKGIEFIFNRLLRPLIPGWNDKRSVIKVKNSTNGNILFFNNSSITFVGSTSDGENVRGCDINFIICSEAGFYPESAFSLYYGALLYSMLVKLLHNKD